MTTHGRVVGRDVKSDTLIKHCASASNFDASIRGKLKLRPEAPEFVPSWTPLTITPKSRPERTRYPVLPEAIDNVKPLSSATVTRHSGRDKVKVRIDTPDFLPSWTPLTITPKSRPERTRYPVLPEAIDNVKPLSSATDTRHSGRGKVKVRIDTPDFLPSLTPLTITPKSSPERTRYPVLPEAIDNVKPLSSATVIRHSGRGKEKVRIDTPDFLPSLTPLTITPKSRPERTRYPVLPEAIDNVKPLSSATVIRHSGRGKEKVRIDTPDFLPSWTPLQSVPSAVPEETGLTVLETPRKVTSDLTDIEMKPKSSPITPECKPPLTPLPVETKSFEQGTRPQVLDVTPALFPVIKCRLSRNEILIWVEQPLTTPSVDPKSFKQGTGPKVLNVKPALFPAITSRLSHSETLLRPEPPLTPLMPLSVSPIVAKYRLLETSLDDYVKPEPPLTPLPVDPKSRPERTRYPVLPEAIDNVKPLSSATVIRHSGRGKEKVRIDTPDFLPSLTPLTITPKSRPERTRYPVLPEAIDNVKPLSSATVIRHSGHGKVKVRIDTPDFLPSWASLQSVPSAVPEETGLTVLETPRKVTSDLTDIEMKPKSSPITPECKPPLTPLPVETKSFEQGTGPQVLDVKPALFPVIKCRLSRTEILIWVEQPLTPPSVDPKSFKQGTGPKVLNVKPALFPAITSRLSQSETLLRLEPPTTPLMPLSVSPIVAKNGLLETSLDDYLKPQPPLTPLPVDPKSFEKGTGPQVLYVNTALFPAIKNRSSHSKILLWLEPPTTPLMPLSVSPIVAKNGLLETSLDDYLKPQPPLTPLPVDPKSFEKGTGPQVLYVNTALFPAIKNRSSHSKILLRLEPPTTPLMPLSVSPMVAKYRLLETSLDDYMKLEPPLTPLPVDPKSFEKGTGPQVLYVNTALFPAIKNRSSHSKILLRLEPPTTPLMPLSVSPMVAKYRLLETSLDDYMKPEPPLTPLPVNPKSFEKGTGPQVLYVNTALFPAIKNRSSHSKILLWLEPPTTPLMPLSVSPMVAKYRLLETSLDDYMKPEPPLTPLPVDPKSFEKGTGPQVLYVNTALFPAIKNRSSHSKILLRLEPPTTPLMPLSVSPMVAKYRLLETSLDDYMKPEPPLTPLPVDPKSFEKGTGPQVLYVNTALFPAIKNRSSHSKILLWLEPPTTPLMPLSVSPIVAKNGLLETSLDDYLKPQPPLTPLPVEPNSFAQGTGLQVLDENTALFPAIKNRSSHSKILLRLEPPTMPLMPLSVSPTVARHGLLETSLDDYVKPPPQCCTAKRRPSYCEAMAPEVMSPLTPLPEVVEPARAVRFSETVSKKKRRRTGCFAWLFGKSEVKKPSPPEAKPVKGIWKYLKFTNRCTDSGINVVPKTTSV